MAGSNLEIFEAAADLLTQGRPSALAVVIRRHGSAPQVEGARMLLSADGRLWGTVGGGAIEAKVLAACHRVLRERSSHRVAANLVRDLGMCCGGSMDVFVEYLAPASEARVAP